MKKYFLAILVIIQCIPLFSQVSAGSLQQSFCEVSSPESFAMTKYGAVNSAMYTGAFSYNLPVYTYKDIDFEIPISLGYHFDGLGRLSGTSRGEHLEYDLNSNILRYNQKTYFYDGNYRTTDDYNERGQITEDAQSGTRIEYTVGGLPLTINNREGSKAIVYSYFADGSKYSAISKTGEGYIYRGNFLYCRNAEGNEYIESIKTKNGRIINEDGGPKYIHFTSDLIGSSQALVELDGTQANIREQDTYLPYGRRYVDADYRTESTNRYRFSGKEEQRVGWFDTPYIDFGARFYNPQSGSWLGPDEKALSYPYLSPYSYCGSDPINFYDPDGNNPIYSNTGQFLGTDANGLQGEYLIMNEKDFVQGMSHNISVSLSLDRNLLGDSIKKSIQSQYSQLALRPDYDGYLTLKEANEWYRSGSGEALFAAFDKLSIPKLDLDKLEKTNNGGYRVNLFKDGKLKDALVYGQIIVYRTTSGNLYSKYDIYDFDKHVGNGFSVWLRNFLTSLGQVHAGSGTSFVIYFYGEKNN